MDRSAMYAIRFAIPVVIGLIYLIVWIVKQNKGGNRKRNEGTNNASPPNQYQQGTNRYQETYPFEEKATVYNKPTRKKEISIGRSHSNDIVIDERYEDVSRIHATITGGSELILKDDSSFGSYVNGQKVHHSQKIIRQGDTIKLGKDYQLSWGEINKLFSNGNSSRETQRRLI